MASIVTFPWRVAHQAMGMEQISIGQFALASAPVIGAPVAIAHTFRPIAAYILTVLGRPVPEFMKFPAGTTAFQIDLVRHDYIKAGMLSAVMTVAIAAACVCAGVLVAGGTAALAVSIFSLYSGAVLLGAWLSLREKVNGEARLFHEINRILQGNLPVRIQIQGRTVDLIQAPQA